MKNIEIENEFKSNNPQHANQLKPILVVCILERKLKSFFFFFRLFDKMDVNGITIGNKTSISDSMLFCSSDKRLFELIDFPSDSIIFDLK